MVVGQWRASLALVFSAVVAVAFQNCGNLESPSGENGALVQDSAAPNVFFNVAPSAVTANPNAVFEFGSSDPWASFQCSFNKEPFAPCVSPKTYSGLSDGIYSFEVQAMDGAGNISGTQTLSWKVDRLALSVNITAPIAAFTNVRDHTIQFSKQNANAAVDNFECSLNGAPFSACSSPLVLTGLAQGAYKFQVRAREGSIYSAPAEINWVVDLTPPAINITLGYQGTVYTENYPDTAYFYFLVADAGGSQVKTRMCKLDSGAAQACNGSVSYQITPDGSAHTLTIQATDNAGNTSTATRTFTLFYNPPPPPDYGSGP